MKLDVTIKGAKAFLAAVLVLTAFSYWASKQEKLKEHNEI